MDTFKFYNRITGWIVFLIAAATYILTAEPTVSLWDCGEFIASAYKLQVGHPPGAPLFMIMARVATLFAGDNVENVAFMVNVMSALASAFTILFLFWTITHLALKITGRDNLKPYQLVAVIGSGAIGALAYTFSDTFWFSAVEGEVYASSSFFTAIVFWAILKWENIADDNYSNRWLILIAYLMGLSIGVHLLNLLAIPAIVMVYYFKKYDVTRNGVIGALLIGAAILGGVMYGIIPGLIWLASRFELFFVNTISLPYNSGVIIYLVFLIGGLVYGIYQTHKKPNLYVNIAILVIIAIIIFFTGKISISLLSLILIFGIGFGIYFLYKKSKVLVNTSLLIIAVIVIGYSSYSMIVIRSMANPPMDENSPETVFKLQSYLNREQYGDRPLVHGQYFNAQVIKSEDGKKYYTKKDGKYVVTNRKPKYTYDPKFTGLFPRMWSGDEQHVDAYLEWADIKEKDMYETRKDQEGKLVTDRNGNVVYDHSQPRERASMIQNMRYFFRYQLNWMYMRYFWWNFVGRQDDEQGHGGLAHGNWKTGIKPIDNLKFGASSVVSEDIENAAANNNYYALPFILGVIGLFYHYKKHKKDAWIVMMLFLLTGFAIVVYLSQYPFQPRERDYAYAGSFYAYAIWIGLGVLAIIDMAGKSLKNVPSSVIVTLILLFLVPGIMAKENWDDHDRSDRYLARDIAYNYLNSCAPNAILFTNGDNDTFPLWYAQEVEGIRTDVRIVNLMLLNMDWYADQMKLKAYESEPLPITLAHDQYIDGTRDVVFVQERFKEAYPAKDVLGFIASDDKQTKVKVTTGKEYDYVPTRTFTVPVDSAKVIANGTVNPKDAKLIEKQLVGRIKGGRMTKSDLIALDIIANNNWERPIYFVSYGHSGLFSLDNYLQLDGFAYRLVPIKTNQQGYERGRIDTDILYDKFMNVFKWGGMNEDDVYLDHFHKRTLSVIRMRLRFASLANKLIDEGKLDKAEEVLDKIVELTPHEKVPFDFMMTYVIEGYYKLKKFDKGNALLEKHQDILEANLGHWLDKSQKYRNRAQETIQFDVQVMMQNLRMAQRYGQMDLAERAEKFLTDNQYRF